ncbi:MAG: SCO family protein [Gammaproteobacteria bacterium]|nr:SCO family protein [Gammaproteobacteria bacterium]
MSAHDKKHEPGPSSSFDEASALSACQAALGRQVADQRFFDRRGRAVTLSEFYGRPIVISLIYTSCYHTCPTLTNHLARIAKVARAAVGEDSFSVLTIGFDTSADTPARMQTFARERGIDHAHWRFLTADATTIASLTRDLGFTFFRSPNGFDHIVQTTVLDAKGNAYRQIYGEGFDPPNLVEPLKQLVFGTKANTSTLSGWINGVRLLCTIYDPSSERYRFDYSLLVAIGVGLISLGAVGVFIVRAWRQSNSPTTV